MQTKTICCKLITMPAMAESLKETSRSFANACNYVLSIAIKENTHNAIKLHKLSYYDIREKFDLSANLSVRAIHRVAGAMTKLKGKRKRPKEFKPKSIDYDARIFSYFPDKEEVSLTTVNGRLSIPLRLGEHQRKWLQGRNPTAATVINKGGTWYIHLVIEYEAAICSGSEVMGIDLGINTIAATSTGLLISGKSRQAFKQKRARVRASLQSKGTRGAKKVLKRLSGQEKRRIRHENHVLSKQLVEEAKRHNCGIIRMEQLKEIRAKTKTWNKHTNRMVAGWSFFELQKCVGYKAAACNIETELVNPAYTSQTCYKCLKLGSRNRELFSCLTCGEEHADVNASHVIARGGADCKPARISAAR